MVVCMKCRICGQPINNSFQLVCDSCIRREEEVERQEEEDFYRELEESEKELECEKE